MDTGIYLSQPVRNLQQLFGLGYMHQNSKDVFGPEWVEKGLGDLVFGAERLSSISGENTLEDEELRKLLADVEELIETTAQLNLDEGVRDVLLEQRHNSGLGNRSGVDHHRHHLSRRNESPHRGS